MPDAILHTLHHFKSPKLDLSVTPDLAGTFTMVAKVAKAYEATVMLLGESGSGKSRIARHIHDLSGRASHPFQTIDLSQATESVFESEIFGHEKGSFTGAAHDKKSPFELANGGTVFLDEVGTLPFDLQAKLLRLVQEKTFKRVGGNKDVEVDVRILSATSMDLESAVKNGKFREDLYYRLNVLQIRVPPLRERRGDILPLADYFLQQASARQHLPPKTLSEEAKKLLQSYEWPGNVRTLENEMIRAVVLTEEDVVQPEDLSFYNKGNNVVRFPQMQSEKANPYADIIEQLTCLGTTKAIGEFCDEVKRYLLEMSVLESTTDGVEYKNTKASEFLHCTPSSMGSYAQSLFKLGDLKFASLVKTLPLWRETRSHFPFADLAQSIALTIVEENGKNTDRKNAIKIVEDGILYPAKVALVKTALVKHDFSQIEATKDIKLSDGYITWLIRRDNDFAKWLSQNAPPKGIENRLSFVSSQPNPS